MPRLVSLGIVLVLLFVPTIVLAEDDVHAAAGRQAGEHLDIPLIAVIPFAGLLLSIAVLPLVAEHFWHSNRNRALVSGLFALPVVLFLLYLEYYAGQPGLHALLEALEEYAAFIILLGSLYTISGGIVLDLNVQPKPWVNVLILAVGAVLANLIGTTGASMLLIRPYLRINQMRERTRHLPIFFIFTVSNLGGLLTPLGDPPLFLGFLRGVDFFWTMQLWPQWLIANGLVLAVFFCWDTIAYLREPNRFNWYADMDQSQPVFGLRGLINFILFLGVLGAVLFQSAKIGDPTGEFLAESWNGFAGELNNWFGWTLATGITLHVTLHFPWPEVIMIGMSVLSMWLTPRAYRKANTFGWAAIIEVAVLFIGIFVTMVPALELLRSQGFGLTESWQYFWLTGSLSGFLDNAPTYVTFATVAAGQRDLTPLMTQHGGLLLAAISCGAVFMGALTYIGNGPNFMVKAIADESDYRTPTFFGYLGYSCMILMPIFVLITYLFFW